MAIKGDHKKRRARGQAKPPSGVPVTGPVHPPPCGDTRSAHPATHVEQAPTGEFASPAYWSSLSPLLVVVVVALVVVVLALARVSGCPKHFPEGWHGGRARKQGQ